MPYGWTICSQSQERRITLQPATQCYWSRDNVTQLQLCYSPSLSLSLTQTVFLCRRHRQPLSITVSLSLSPVTSPHLLIFFIFSFGPLSSQATTFTLASVLFGCGCPDSHAYQKFAWLSLRIYLSLSFFITLAPSFLAKRCCCCLYLQSNK